MCVQIQMHRVLAFSAKRFEYVAGPQGAQRSITAVSKAINHKAINVTPWDGYATVYNVYEPLIYLRAGILSAARRRPSFRSLQFRAARGSSPAQGHTGRNSILIEGDEAVRRSFRPSSP